LQDVIKSARQLDATTIAVDAGPRFGGWASSLPPSDSAAPW
jgi:hypothetical protein